MANRKNTATIGLMDRIPGGFLIPGPQGRRPADAPAPVATPALSEADIRRRRRHVKSAIAGSTIEGLKASPKANALLVQYAEGRITREQYFEAISADNE